MKPTKTITIPAQTIEITFAQYVGGRIRERRVALGMTQSDVSEASPISKPHLSDVENGLRRIGFQKLYQLARVLGRSTDWFSKGWDEECR